MKKNVKHHRNQSKNVVVINSKFNSFHKIDLFYCYLFSSKKHRDEHSDDEEPRHRRRRERSSSK
jgi:hypothetical protein